MTDGECPPICLQGPDGQPGERGPPGLPGPEVRPETTAEGAQMWRFQRMLH